MISNENLTSRRENWNIANYAIKMRSKQRDTQGADEK